MFAAIRRGIVGVTLAVAISGCVVRHYSVEMKPAAGAAGGFERRLTVMEYSGTNAARPESNPGQLIETVTTRISGQTPNDIGGGAGSLTQFRTTLGTMGAYVERFRGNDDLAAQARALHAAAEELSGLISGWLETELGRTEGYERLKEWCQTRMPVDIENLMLYTWLGDASHSEAASRLEETAARVVQYLVERGYFSIDEAPRLLRSFYEMGLRGGDGPTVLVREFVARRMGLDPAGPLPASFGFLATEAAAKESVGRYIRGTELYRRAVAAAAEQGKPAPEPLELLSKRQELLAPGVLVNLFGPRAELNVKLELPSAPMLSNGRWDADGHRVTWDSPLQADGATRQQLPVVAYAVWATPEQAEQEARFGRVILDGDRLVQYCLWRCGLTEQEGAVWDAAIGKLTPGPTLGDQVAAMAPMNGVAEWVVGGGLELLRKGLEHPTVDRPIH